LDETNLEARKPGNNLVVAHPPRANLEIRFASPPEEKTKVRRILGFRRNRNREGPLTIHSCFPDSSSFPTNSLAALD
jgi:hypothetical protein